MMDAPARQPAGWKHNAIAAALILICGMAAYLNSLDGAFVFDDLGDVTGDQAIDWPPTMHQLLTATDRPLTDLTFAWQRHVHGVDSARPFHIVNIGIHLMNALLLFALARCLLRNRSCWIAMFIAAIWVVHPLTTQAVTYIVQRSESMMVLCYLLSLVCLSRRRGGWLVCSIVAAAAGMWCKGVMVTIPIATLLFDRCVLATSWREVIKARWWYHLLMFATWGMLIVNGVAGAILMPGEDTGVAAGFAYVGISPGEYLITQAAVIPMYLRLAIWPSLLVLDYAMPAATLGEVILPGLIVAALILVTIWLLWKRPRAGWVAAMFFIILAPTSSIVPLRDIAFEHRMYLPLAAVIGLLAVALARLHRTGAMVFGVMVIAVCMVLTVQRNHDYHDPVVLWHTVAEARPHNVRAYVSVGYEYEQRGDTAQAIDWYERAISVPEDRVYLPIQDAVYVRAHRRLARLHAAAGEPGRAVVSYEAALARRPGDVATLRGLATVYSQEGDHDRAVETLQMLVEGAPNNIDAWLTLGDVNAARRDWTDAATAYRRAVALDGSRARPRTNLAIALAQQGQMDAAQAQFQRAVEVDPADIPARINYAALLRRTGERAAAIDQLRTALRLEPDNVRARRMLDELDGS